MTEVCKYEDTLEHFDNNLELLKTIYLKYKENANTLLDQLEKHIEEMDTKGISETAHALKGSSSNFFALALTDILQEIEVNCSNLSQDEIKTKLANIKVEFQKFTEFLDNKLA